MHLPKPRLVKDTIVSKANYCLQDPVNKRVVWGTYFNNFCGSHDCECNDFSNIYDAI